MKLRLGHKMHLLLASIELPTPPQPPLKVSELIYIPPAPYESSLPLLSVNYLVSYICTTLMGAVLSSTAAELSNDR